MSLAEIRRRFYGAGDAHAYVRSDDATYRMADGRPMPAAGVRRQPEPEPDPMESYSAAERALLERMTVIQRDMYLEIREAAEVGDWSPSYRDLGETINGSDWRVGKMLAELQELG